MGRSLAVSVVNTRQWSWLEPCLQSVLDHPYRAGPFEVVVLDNASDDGSVDRLRERFPDVRVIAETTRRGFGANHGIVAAAVDADLVLFLNPDTLMQEATMDRLALSFDADDRVVAAGGPIISPDGEVWRAAPFPFPTPWGAVREAVGWHRRSAPAVAPEGLSLGAWWLSGSAIMVDRRVFLACGGFDPRFFLYFEETDLAKRLTEAGGLFAFASDAPIVHEGQTTERAVDAGRPSGPAETKTTTEFERSAVAYMRKHFGWGGALLYRGALLLGGSGRWLATYSPPVARRMQTKGGSPEATRRHHRRRAGVALRPTSGTSIGDAAAAWNQQHHERLGG